MLKSFFYFLRDLRYQMLFQVLHQYANGHVLDIGGWDFCLTAIKRKIPFEHWTVLEYDESHLPQVESSRVTIRQGDGCNMDYPDEQFDTIVCIQVAEHVFTPIQLFEESVRVLKKGCYGIYMFPQTGNLHSAPYHYQNFTRFWAIEMCKRSGVDLVELHSLGGTWSTMASRLLYTPFQMLRFKGFTYPSSKRNFLYYLLAPLAFIFIVIGFPVCLLLSLGDMEEEANNHLFVFRK
ncbi:MAG: class I SAM-dependent methyltransferase [Verrucomicrobiota bacterium]|nr:class I SAM-dependent methyltransferase [Verrucomicrobiota bacterium]